MDISGSAFCHATEICFPIVRNLGCEKATWDDFRFFRNNVLRKILCPGLGNGCWRRRKISEIFKLFDDIDLWNLLSLGDLNGLAMWWGGRRKSFVSNQDELWIEEADQIWGGATRYRRTSHGLGADIGEFMRSQENNGGKSLRRSSPS